jgi:hypothetical protein
MTFGPTGQVGLDHDRVRAPLLVAGIGRVALARVAVGRWPRWHETAHARRFPRSLGE